MKLVRFFSALLFFLPIAVYAQDQYKDQLLRFAENRKQFASLDYDITWANKSFSSIDTLKWLAKVQLVRNEADSVFGGYLSIEMDSLWYGYDGHHIMEGNKAKSTLITADAGLYPNVYIRGTSVIDLVEQGFLLKGRGPVEYYDYPDVIKIISDSIVRGVNTTCFTFLIPDEGGFSKQVLKIGIDAKDLTPVFRMYSVWFQENEQYTLWEFDKVKFHNETHIPLFDSIHLNAYEVVTVYERKPRVASEQAKFDFSTLSGNTLKSEELVALKNEKADFIILDFWYAACYPCIKSIPAVNRIAEHYSGKNIRVYGVNPIDDESKHADRLFKFLRNNPMQYKTIMLDPGLQPQLGLEGYPTIMILDKDLQVIYKEVGFSETLFEEVSAFLDSRM